ncbi:hypothetical protein DENSPDRAFT_713682 [Dentipellis sp. KUC8613]|nr:hypothetical protein DENSPDRAFT_713682 [Dentipellis sp. KUC8613]
MYTRLSTRYIRLPNVRVLRPAVICSTGGTGRNTRTSIVLPESESKDGWSFFHLHRTRIRTPQGAFYGCRTCHARPAAARCLPDLYQKGTNQPTNQLSMWIQVLALAPRAGAPARARASPRSLMGIVHCQAKCCRCILIVLFVDPRACRGTGSPVYVCVRFPDSETA